MSICIAKSINLVKSKLSHFETEGVTVYFARVLNLPKQPLASTCNSSNLNTTLRVVAGMNFLAINQHVSSWSLEDAAYYYLLIS
jgi:hypothetical protein